MRVGVDLVVVVALSDSLLCLPGAAGVQAIAETAVRITAAVSNVMRMGCMISRSSARTVRLGLVSDCGQL